MCKLSHTWMGYTISKLNLGTKKPFLEAQYLKIWIATSLTSRSCYIISNLLRKISTQPKSLQFERSARLWQHFKSRNNEPRNNNKKHLDTFNTFNTFHYTGCWIGMFITVHYNPPHNWAGIFPITRFLLLKWHLASPKARNAMDNQHLPSNHRGKKPSTIIVVHISNVSLSITYIQMCR